MIERQTRYCTSCQTTRNATGGYKKPGSNRGWRCAICLSRQSVSPYQSIQNMEKLNPEQASKGTA